MDLLKKIFILVFFTVAVAVLSRVFLISHYIDFESFYFATKAFYAGSNPYLELNGTVVGFLYAPTSFLFFSLFTLFPLEISGLLWTLYSVILLVISICLLFKIAKRKILSYEFMGMLGLVFMMFPVKFSLGMGQVGMLNLFLVTLFLYLISKNKERFTGAGLAFCLLLKFSPLFYPFYLIVLRKWRTLLIMFLTISSIFIAVFIFRPEQMMYFLTKSLPGTFNSWPMDYYNQALSGAIGRSLGKGEVAQLVKLLSSGFLIAVSFYVLWKKRSNKSVLQLGYTSLLPLSIIIAPLAWQHYFVLVIPTLITLYFYYQKNGAGAIRYLVLVMSYLFIAANIKSTEGISPLILSHVLWGTLVLWGLSIYEVNKHE